MTVRFLWTNELGLQLLAGLRKAFPQLSIEAINCQASALSSLPQNLDSTEILVVTNVQQFPEGLKRDRFQNLKWIHSSFAGAGHILQGFFEPGKPLNCTFTRSAHTWSVPLAESAIGRIIEHEKFFLEVFVHQRTGKFPCWNTWKRNIDRPPKALTTDDDFNIQQLNARGMYSRPLSDIRIGLMGFGSIGREIAWRAKVLGIEVWALVRQLPTTDDERSAAHKYVLSSELPTLLSSCDYIINSLPDTPQTRSLLSGDTFRHCAPKSAVFMNYGRGSITDEVSIIKALDQGWLSKAILDVFEVEPVPETSQLWQHPKVIMTPHSSAMDGRAVDRFVQDFAAKYEKFLKGEVLDDQVDPLKGY